LFRDVTVGVFIRSSKQ